MTSTLTRGTPYQGNPDRKQLRDVDSMLSTICATFRKYCEGKSTLNYIIVTY